MNDRMQSIVQMRQSGASYAMIKSEFGISDSTIVYSLKKAGLSRKRKAITDDIKKQILKLRDEGLPFWQIAEQTGVSATGAYKVYIKHIEPEAAKLRRQGKSYTEIGQIFGVNSATARRMCLRAGSLGPEESAEAKAIEKPSVRIDIRIGSPVRIYSADRVGNGEWREGVVRDLYDCFFIVDYGKTRECFLYSDLTCPDTSWRFNKNSHAELRNYFMQELNKSGKTVKQLEQEIPNYSAHHWFRFSSDYRIPTRNNYLRLQEITGCFDRNYDDVRAEFMEEKK